MEKQKLLVVSFNLYHWDPTQSKNESKLGNRDTPKFVNSYATVLGTVSYTVLLTKSYSSSSPNLLLRVVEDVSNLFFNSVNRRGLSSECKIISIYIIKDLERNWYN